MISNASGVIRRKFAILLLAGLAISPALHASPLGSSIISMFPKDVRELEYANLVQFRQVPWFPQFETKLVPASIAGFEQFLDNAQGQHPPSIDQVAWARVPVSGGESGRPATGSGQLVAVGVGQFDVETIKSFLDSRNAPSVQVESDVLYASQTDLGMSEGYFILFDSETIAFGPLEGLKRLVEVRAGKEGNLSGNTRMMSLINQANGDSVFWGVFDSGQAGTVLQHLVPDVMKFPQADDLVGKLKELLIRVSASDDVGLNFQTDSASPSDAIILSQLLEATMLEKRYQASKDNPALAKILDGVVISPFDSHHLDVSFNLTDDQMLSLIEHNTLNLSM
jgi:hypothetical protein